MRFALVWIGAALWIQTYAFAAEVTPLQFETSDHQQIAANWYHDPAQPQSRVIVFAPGLSQYKDSQMMRKMSQALTQFGEVVNFDFRGTGQSPGWFEFGAKEFQDIEPILKWARSRFASVNLLGVSLGAYSSLRAASEWPELIDHLMVLSAPTSADDVFWNGNLIWSTVHDWFHHDPWASFDQGNPFYHYGNLLAHRPDARDFVGRISVPTGFMVGTEDRTVPMNMSLEVYGSVQAPKDWDVVQNGRHAEEMFLQYPEHVLGWVADHLAK